MPSIPPTRSLLTLMVALTLLASAAVFGGLVRADYAATMREAERSLGEVAHLMEEHAGAVDGNGTLGLTLIMALADQIGGSAQFRNDRGTEFRLTFPV